MADLTKIPLDDLEHELQRRRRWRADHESKPLPYCDDCAHFIALAVDPIINDPVDVPANYNPCEVGHKMSLRIPDGPTTNDWGYYRVGCKDRVTPPGDKHA